MALPCVVGIATMGAVGEEDSLEGEDEMADSISGFQCWDGGWAGLCGLFYQLKGDWGFVGRLQMSRFHHRHNRIDAHRAY